MSRTPEHRAFRHARRRGGPLAPGGGPRLRQAFRLAAALALVPVLAPRPAPGLAGQEVRPPGRPIPAVDDFVHDGTVSEWRGRPVDRILPAADGTPQILAWMGQVAGGLVVAFEARGPLATGADPVLEVELAGPRPPELPPIGWGHQFGIEVLTDAGGCEDLEFGAEEAASCRAWYAEQEALRASIPRLFERRWRMPLRRPETLSEVHASTVYRALDAATRRSLSPLRPSGTPGTRTRPIAGTEGGIGFELLIPWSAFPPVPAPDLEEVRLDVRWAAAGDPVESSAGARPRPLARALVHRISPCDYGLRGLLIPGAENQAPRPASEDAVAYMIPDSSGDLRSLIVLDHPVAGYQYEPDPEARSPSAFRARYDVLDVGRGERLCTPILALVSSGERRTPPDWSRTGESGGGFDAVDLRHLEVRRLEDGDLLALQRPRAFYSYYGSGQCGGCPRIAVDLSHVSVSSGEVTPLLRLRDIAEPGARDVEIEVSDDWSLVTVYRSTTDWSPEPPRVTWTATRWCRDAEEGPAAPFEECGVEEDVPEPPVRLRSSY